jgi:hypothetical protein
MREYARFAPQFWKRGTGKALRGDLAAQVLATYLMTAPASGMTGIFFLSFSDIEGDTGIPEPEIERVIARLESMGFLHYDRASELAWVVNLAQHQLEKPIVVTTDKRFGGVIREIKQVGRHRFVNMFFDRYRTHLCLPVTIYDASLNGQMVSPDAERDHTGRSRSLVIEEHGEEHEHEHGEEHEQRAAVAGAVPSQPLLIPGSPDPEPDTKTKKPHRITLDWEPKASTIQRFAGEGYDAQQHVEEFRNHWFNENGSKAIKKDWDLTFINRMKDLVEWGKAKRLTVVFRAPPPEAKPVAPTMTPEERQAARQSALDAEQAIRAVTKKDF